MDSESPENAGKIGNVHWSDILVIAIYFVLIMAVGLWSMCRKNRGTTQGYFLAGRQMAWWPVGASLFASNIGSEHFIGLAGSGAAAGIAVGVFELNAILILQVLGFIFVPVYTASGVFTMPEYMRRRYGGNRIQMYLTILSLLLYIFTKISVDLFAGATFIEQAIGLNIYISIVSLLLITSVYTIAGGLAAVIYTDTVQAFIMVVGAVVLMVMSFVKVGGYSGLHRQYFDSIPQSMKLEIAAGNNTNLCGIPRDDAFSLLRDASSGDLPWPGALIGTPLLSLWYWCTDQIIVQRTLSAKNLTHAKGGTIFAGWLKLLPLFLIIFPGMISRVLYPESVACATPEACMAACNSEISCSNIAYPKLVLGVLPVGARGLMLAVMLSALMSSLTSIFNSASTLFTMDIWRKARKSASERELMIVGRLFIIALVGVSIIWVPIVQASHSGQLFNYIQAVQSMLTPPISLAFLLGVCWGRTTELGAFAGLVVGMAIGLIRFVLEFTYGEPKCGEEEWRPAVLYKIHYTHFAIILFFVCGVVTVVVSLLTKPIDAKHLHRLTWSTRHSKEIRVDVSDRKGEYSMEDGSHGDGNVDNNEKEEEANRLTIEEFTPEEETVKQQTKARTFYEWFCGYSSNTDEVEASVARNDALRKGIDISESPMWKSFTTVNCMIVLMAAVFLMGFFAHDSSRDS